MISDSPFYRWGLWGPERGNTQWGQSWLQSIDFRFLSSNVAASCSLCSFASCRLGVSCRLREDFLLDSVQVVRRAASLSTTVVEEQPAGPLYFQDASEQQDKMQYLLITKIPHPQIYNVIRQSRLTPGK
jgi:hypothetical protein